MFKSQWARGVGLLLLSGAGFGCAVRQPNLVDMNAGFVRVDSDVSADFEVEDLIQEYKDQLDSEMNEVIGKAAFDLNNNSGVAESVLGNFVSDLILSQSIEYFGSQIDLALINARGGLRIPISKGDITVGKVFELMPFDNEVWVVELSGAQTQQLFDHCARTERMALGGARYKMKGKRAVGIQIGGVSFDVGQTYLLAVPDFLATGGGRFDFLPRAKVRRKLNYSVRDMIIDHIRSLSRKSLLVEAQLDGRVIRLP